MILHEIKEKQIERALIIGVWTEKQEKHIAESLLKELSMLADTAHIPVVHSELIRLREKTPSTLLGSGKIEELDGIIHEHTADAVIFDTSISPLQQRNLEAAWNVQVFDRSELIIKIFAQRAHTKEAQLQVELARLEYFLPRLLHAHDDLHRQKGGRYGTKDAGEKQLELDRRYIENRIVHIKKELIEVRKVRETQRKRREKSGILHISLVGYTNAGKSTLFNRLTKASVYAENKLFATLDTTTRRICLSGRELIITDTVGFIRNLPHGLIAAFKATLEEAVFSDMLLIVADASDPECEEQIATTRKVLSEIGCGGIPARIVMNKIDLQTHHANADFSVSALTGEGIDALLEFFKNLTVCEYPK